MHVRLGLLLGLLLLVGCGESSTPTPSGAGTTPPPGAGAEPDAGPGPGMPGPGMVGHPPLPVAPTTPPGPVLRIVVDAEGGVSFRGGPGGGDVLATLGSEDPSVTGEALLRIQGMFEHATGDPSLREEDGTSRALLEIEAAPGARWRYAQWLMQAAASPRVKIRRIRLRLRGDPHPFDYEIPADATLVLEDADAELGESEPISAPGMVPPAAETDAAEPLVVKLFRRDRQSAEGGFTRIRIGDRFTYNLPKGWPKADGESAERRRLYGQAFEGVEAGLRGIGQTEGHPVRQGLLLTPPPLGTYVPFCDAMNALRAFRAAGLVHVEIGGAPSPLPDRR